MPSREQIVTVMVIMTYHSRQYFYIFSMLFNWQLRRIRDSSMFLHTMSCCIELKICSASMQIKSRNPLKGNLRKDGIDCNVTTIVSGLRCTLFKTAVHRIPLQKIKTTTLLALL